MMNASNNYNHGASNIPLPPGSPPSMRQEQQQSQSQLQQQQHLQLQQQQRQLHHNQLNPQQQQQQQYHQQPQQHMQPQQQQQQQPQSFFGSIAQPSSFEALARNNQNIVASTLQQYGPGAMAPAMHHINYHSMIPRMPTTHMNPIQQQQQHPLQQHMQQQQQQQQTVLQYNNQQHSLQQQQQRYGIYNQRPMLNTGQTVIRTTQPPTYHLNPTPTLIQPTISRLPTYVLSPTKTATNQASPFVNRSGANINVNITSQPAITASASTSSSNPSTSVATPPPAPISPPLDALNTHQNELAIQDRPTDSSTAQSTQPPRFDILADVRARCETMTLNQMLEEYRSLKQKLEESQLKRSTLEKEICDIQRKTPGQNLEVNASFKRKKAQKIESDNKCRDINDAIKLVADKLDKKYSHKVQDHEIKQPLQHSRKVTRAKMSTAAPSPSSSRSIHDKDESGILFNLEDGDLWCKICDVHCKSLKEYCDHLHKRNHMDIMKETNKSSHMPWKRDGKSFDQLDKYKTFTKFKSICSLLSGKLDSRFIVQDMDDIMNPSIKKREDLKKLIVSRERNEISKDDPLFTIKGFEYLIPITGFYCKLCNRTMCDTSEVEEHLKGYNHNYEHTKSVALNPDHEKSFRLKLEKSLKELREADKPKQSSHAKSRDLIAPSHTRTSPAAASASTSTSATASTSTPATASASTSTAANASISTSTSTSTSSSTTTTTTTSTAKTASLSTATKLPNAINGKESQYSARLPYKKPTSKIVDEHDVIADKFEKRDGPDPSLPRPSKSRPDPASLGKSPSKSKESPKKRKIPEIVPLSRTLPAASLKRLRNEKISDQDIDASRPPRKEKAKVKEKELEKENGKKKSANKEKDAKKDDKDLDEADEAPYTAFTRLDSSSEDEGPEPKSSDCRDDESTSKSDDDDVQFIKEVHLEPGDPDSPFPDLDLVVTGNTPVVALKDKRLKQGPSVMLNRINLEDYKDMILATSSVWTRVDQLMTKKEPSEFEKDLESVTFTAPSYFQQNGETVPVDIDASSEGDLPLDMNMLTNFFCEK